MSVGVVSGSRHMPKEVCGGDGGLPRVWAVLSGRAGDDAQILALARALGWPYEVKRLVYRRGSRCIDVWRGANLLGIDGKRSSPLVAPWPDLVISASMRNEPVCRWICRESEGRARYVHIGKPWGRVSAFDLVIAVPEYRWLPDLPNVLRNRCSLHEVTAERLDREAEIWSARVASLPRPLLAVVVGGYAGPYPFDRVSAHRLGREASERARRLGGSLLVTTSKRTSGAATAALRSAIDVPFTFFEWEGHVDANPYFGFLALADEIIVTCDSTSMLAEACATRKPVHIFDLSPACDGEGSAKASWGSRLSRDRTKAFLYRNVLLRIAPNRLKRDIRQVHKVLIESGRAVWLGSPLPKGEPLPLDEMSRALHRVWQLFS